MKLHTIAFVLLLIGGLNWGLEIFGVGIGHFVSPMIADVVYALVAISAIIEAVGHKNNCMHCSADKKAPMPQGNM